MKFLTVLLIGSVLGFLGYTGSYSLLVEPVGEVDFILQETIGIDDNHDKLVWCELDGMCVVEPYTRENGKDPFNAIGSATKVITITRIDQWLSIPTGVLLNREVKSIILWLVGSLCSSMIMIIVLTISLVRLKPTVLE